MVSFTATDKDVRLIFVMSGGGSVLNAFAFNEIGISCVQGLRMELLCVVSLDTVVSGLDTITVGSQASWSSSSSNEPVDEISDDSTVSPSVRQLFCLR